MRRNDCIDAFVNAWRAAYVQEMKKVEETLNMGEQHFHSAHSNPLRCPRDIFHGQKLKPSECFGKSCKDCWNSPIGTVGELKK